MPASVLLRALLDCPNPSCRSAYEAYGTAAELRALACEICGHELEPVAFAEAHSDSRPRDWRVRPRRAA